LWDGCIGGFGSEAVTRPTIHRPCASFVQITLSFGPHHTYTYPWRYEPASPLGEDTVYTSASKPDKQGSKDGDDSLSSSRRHSLPYIYNELPLLPPLSPSTTTRTRRPHSADQDTSPASTTATKPSSSFPCAPHKLSSKYSLLNLFRKAGDNTPESSPYVHSLSSFSTPLFMSPSPAPGPAPLPPHPSPSLAATATFAPCSSNLAASGLPST
jgi:hypothetical protein